MVVETAPLLLESHFVETMYSKCNRSATKWVALERFLSWQNRIFTAIWNAISAFKRFFLIATETTIATEIAFWIPDGDLIVLDAISCITLLIIHITMISWFFGEERVQFWSEHLELYYFSRAKDEHLLIGFGLYCNSCQLCYYNYSDVYSCGVIVCFLQGLALKTELSFLVRTL